MDNALFVKMGLQVWNTQVNRAQAFFDNLSDQDFQKQIAPGKNRIIYLYGHITAYHDLLKETLGIGQRTYPQLFETFLQNADARNAVMPTIGELRQYWNDVHTELNTLFNNMPAQEWFERHNSMTDEDFEKDPSRNRLSVLLSRANHIAYHYGQLMLA
jgi:hypothetical protein